MQAALPISVMLLIWFPGPERNPDRLAVPNHLVEKTNISQIPCLVMGKGPKNGSQTTTYLSQATCKNITEFGKVVQKLPWTILEQVELCAPFCPSAQPNVHWVLQYVENRETMHTTKKKKVGTYGSRAETLYVAEYFSSNDCDHSGGC